MKQSPDLDRAERLMQPGVITLDGFLGTDSRPLTEILAEDDNAVHRLDLTHAQIADRMAFFAVRAAAGLGTTVTVEDRFDVRVEEVRGVLPCPFGHPGLYPKCNVYLKDRRTGEQLSWTALTEHLVRAHGFYEGKGSPFRVEPAAAKRVLGM